MRTRKYEIKIKKLEEKRWIKKCWFEKEREEWKMKEDNKYWLEEERRKCMFCKEGKDGMEHLVKNCRVAKKWFEKLGRNKEKRDYGKIL